MEALTTSARIARSPPHLPHPIFSPSRRSFTGRPLLIPISSGKNGEEGQDLSSGPKDSPLAPFFNNSVSLFPLSKDAVMGLVLSAASGRGWTTGSGMEGPASPEPYSGAPQVSTFPWSLFTRSPRRRMRVAFTCNVCGQRTTRAINPHAYAEGTVFVQCCGCNVFHKLVDNLNLFHGMNCYVNPSFCYKGGMPFNLLDGEDEDKDNGGNAFPEL